MPQVFVRQIRGAERISFLAIYSKVRKEVERAVDAELKPHLLQYFERIVSRWENEPEFKARKKVTAREISLYVYPAGPSKPIWEYVSGGTPERSIPKQPLKGKKRMVFMAGGTWKPKTSRGGHYKGAGKMIGGKLVFARQVKRHKIKAREFEKHIARWAKPKSRKIIENALRRGLRAQRRSA